MDPNHKEDQSSKVDTTDLELNGDSNEAQCKTSENGAHDKISKKVTKVDRVTADSSSSLTPPSSPDGKRSKSAPKSPNFPAETSSPSPSPPKFVTLEEIMKAANGVSNLFLAHEIALNQDFTFEKSSEKANPFKKQVETIMKQAFWDVLQSQLNETPVNYKQALNLLEEVKATLLSFLLPQHTRLKQEIEEILDLDLIKQQAENGALDFQRYAQYILSVMARLCAPVRDEKIRELTQTTEVVPLFRGIMELLDLMKLDMANFAIKQVRPHLLQHSVKYEQEKFKEFMETHSKLGNEDTLEFTKKWLKRNFDKLKFSETESNTKNKINKVIIAAYIELLVWDESKQELFPETLLMDESRIQTLRLLIQEIVYVASVLLVTFSVLGPSFQELSELKEELKQHMKIVLHFEKDENDIKAKFEAAAAQVIADVKKYSEKCSLQHLDDSKESLLKSQIIDICNTENRVRKIVEKRVLEFVESVFTSNSAAPIKLPTGLSTLQQELASFVGQFMRIITHNRAVFGEYYTKIVEEIIEQSTKA
ncbi:T-complex protein 11-like protein 1 [Dinothrombium tinctorium]|uniref:T-complex protein 11-like protein 1 n=1 Tax=Dinothrombium tinctorium TaxID=1965070 RepID=A0A443RJ00_9ACAR|nr:T-complex protein 11-like protein 1 [Dinothrombium tinctorium]